MRCSEARRRLTGSKRDDSSVLEDQELRSHLASCAACAREAEVARIMKTALDTSAADDNSAKISLVEQQQLIEARISNRISFADQVVAWLAKLRFLWWRRPSYSVSIGLTVAVIAVVTFVPFSYNKTLGYDVAFANVCREVALDDEQICDMLHSLGLGEAAVDLEGCDSLCNLNIICLRSEEEVRMVVAALQNLCRTEMTSSVIPMVDRTSGSLLNQANERVFRRGQGG